MSVPMQRVLGVAPNIGAAVQIPVFYMTGTNDDGPIGSTRAADRRVAFDQTESVPAYLLTFKGGDHMVFARFRASFPHDEDFHRLILTASTAFWDAYLKHDAAARHYLSGVGFEEALGGEGTFEKKGVSSSR